MVLLLLRRHRMVAVLVISAGEVGWVRVRVAGWKTIVFSELTTDDAPRR